MKLIKHLIICVISCFSLSSFAAGLAQKGEQKTADKEHTNSWNSIPQEQLQTLLEHFKLESGSGQFQQQKQFALLKHPILSSGEYQLDNSQTGSMIWQVNTPFYDHLKITKTSISQKKSKNDSYQTMPSPPQLSNILFSIFTGELKQLKGFSWQINPEQCLKAKVENKNLTQFITQLSLCKKSKKTQIDFYDQNKTHTQILLEASSNSTKQDSNNKQKSTSPIDENHG